MKSFRRQSGSTIAHILALAGAVAVAAGVGFSVLSNNHGNASKVSRQLTNADLLQHAVTTLAAEAAPDQDGLPLPPAGLVVVPGITGSETPAGGWQVPAASKAPKKDAFGNLVGYCAWNVGSSNAGAGYFQGGVANVTAPFLAVISPGKDKVFSTNCTQAKSGIANGDDAVRYLTVGASQQVKNGGSAWLDPVDCFDASTPATDVLGNPANCASSTSRLDLLPTAGLPNGALILAKKSGSIYQWYGGQWQQVGGASGGYNSSGFKAVTFNPVNGATPNTLVESNSVQVTGIGNAILLTVANGEFAISNDNVTWSAWQSAPGSISAGQYLKLRQTSSASFSTTVTTTVNVGGTTQPWNVTTRAANTAPNAFSFTPVTGAALSTVTPSNTVTITGIDIPVSISATGDSGTNPECNVNSGGWGTCSGTITSGSTLQVRQTSSGTQDIKTAIYITVGTGSAVPFNVTTASASYVEDLFNVQTYTGRGIPQSIPTGVKLADSPVTQAFSAFAYYGLGASQAINIGWDASNGAMVWIKDRTNAADHRIIDTLTGAQKELVPNQTVGQVLRPTGLTAFTSTGFSLGGYSGYNTDAASYIAWAFAKKPRFMDIVTWSGNGVAGRQIPHSLGVTPGMIIVKATNTTTDWAVWHKELTASANLSLNTNSPATLNYGFGTPDSSNLVIATATTSLNAVGNTYVAYVFAHDSAADGMIQTGSYTGANGVARSVNLGWRPQWVMVKVASSDVGSTGSWRIVDLTRTNGAYFQANTASTEGAATGSGSIAITQTGFTVQPGDAATNGSATHKYVYMAIRAPETSASGGGMVWTKVRDASYEHMVYDTLRGESSFVMTQSPAAAGNSLDAMLFNGPYHTVKPIYSALETNLKKFVTYTFKRAPRFFDVVTWTGDGASGRAIPHSLGVVPGMVILKATTAGSTNWFVAAKVDDSYHHYGLTLNTTGASAGPVTSTAYFSANDFKPAGVSGATATSNAAGVTYVAYLFAHDTAATGVIKTGSYTGNNSAETNIELGWEPQYILAKNVTSAGWDWLVYDNTRGLSATGGTALLVRANSTAAEVNNNDAIVITPTGFKTLASSSYPNQAGTYIYLAIRRGPMKQPTSGTQLYQAVTYTGDGVNKEMYGVGFPPDMAINSHRNASPASNGHTIFDRLRGPGRRLDTPSTAAELAMAAPDGRMNSDGIWLERVSGLSNYAGVNYVYHFFRRFPGVFDQVAFAGTSTTGQVVPHALGVKPELIILKPRTGASTYWGIHHKDLGFTSRVMYFDNSTGTSGGWLTNEPTSTQFQILSMSMNLTGYLFASKAGISKVGSYTGSASDVTVDTGFTGAPRFLLIKRTDAPGPWQVFDSARGMVSGGADPVFDLSTTAIEASSSNLVEPTGTGFIAKTGQPDVNTAGGNYVFLAIR